MRDYTTESLHGGQTLAVWEIQRNLHSVNGVEIQHQNETEVDAFITRVLTGDKPDYEYFVKESAPYGDYHLAKTIAPHFPHGRGFSSLGAAIERIRALRATGEIGLYYGD